MKNQGTVITIVTLAAAGALAGIYFSTDEGKKNGRKILKEANKLIQTTGVIAGIAEKFGVISPGIKHIIQGVAETTDRKVNKLAQQGLISS
jgi:hypothetical protein